MDFEEEVEKTRWRHKKKSRKKCFHIQRRCVSSQVAGFMHEMYVKFGWYDWSRYRSYETEKGRDTALNLFQSAKPNPLSGEWECRKEEDGV